MKRILKAALFVLSVVSAHAQYATITGTLQASNGLPASNYTLAFTPTQFGFIAGTGVQVNTTSFCATSTDGTVVGIGNPLQSGTMLPQYTGGTLPVGNYYAYFTWYVTSGPSTYETLPSPEMTAQLGATGSLLFAPPTSGVPAGATGMKIYIGTSPGTETYQGLSVGSGTYTRSSPLATGVAPPSSNTTICKQVANDAIWPVGTGYQTSLTDSSGNTLPGYPMTWQLLGPNTTINLSYGLPYYHGVVTFPVPLLSAPLNRATQSIAGGLAVAGPLSGYSVNGVTNAATQPGNDISAKIAAAIASCQTACDIYIPAGVYSFNPTISIPVTSLSGITIRGSGQQTILNYTGSGDAIAALGAGQSQVGLILANMQIQMGASATSAIHLRAFNLATLYNVGVHGTNGGDCLYVEGANAVSIYSPSFSGCANGVHNKGTVVSGVGYAANAVNAYGGQIFGNSVYGWLEDATGSAVPGPNGANGVFGTTFDLNGTNMFLQGVNGFTISGAYFEYGSGTHTSELILGDSSYVARSVAISDVSFYSAGTTTNTINDFNSAAVTVIANNEQGAVTNFYNRGVLSRGGYMSPTNLATAATNFFVGTDGGSDFIGPCSGCVNGFNSSLRGVAFNTISGYGSDLSIRERGSSSGKILNFRDAAGNVQGSVDNTGIAAFQGVNIAAGTTMTGNQGTGLLAQHSTGILTNGNLLMADGSANDVDSGITASTVPIKVGTPTSGKATCWKTSGTIGYCSTQPDGTGACTCN